MPLSFPTKSALVAALLAAGATSFSFADGTQNNKAPLVAGMPTFERDILPIFQAKCLRCHGDKSRKGDLDLRTVAATLKGGESGAGFIPGQPAKSILYEKVHQGEMPPGKKDPLTPAQLQTLEAWIAQASAPGAANGPPSDKASAGEPPSQHDIIPIMLRHCVVCHGRHRQEGGLDLRTREAMLRGGKSGPAIVAGKPDESRLLLRIRAGQMPPIDRLVEVSVKPTDAQAADLIARWIALGAPESKIEPDVASTAPDPLVSDQDRDFWAFRAPKPVTIPKPGPSLAKRMRNPIDAFIGSALQKQGLEFASEADRATLMRRAYFDLTGLPPEPAEVEAFLQSKDPQAYEAMIDRLLASPRYGERWGRYWLDLAGYSDSEGKREQDLPRPYAWRYRDYVIRAFNADKPYDRFLLEQIAGDELADYEKGPITPEVADNLIATAFLHLAPDPTWANITGYLPDRLDVIADEIDILGSGVMGLTLKCARCHTHKFDPIPHRDYYRLVDILKGALDEHDWLKPEVRPGIGPVSQDFLPGRHLPFVSDGERKSWQDNEARITVEITRLRGSLENQIRERAQQEVKKKLQEFGPLERAKIQAMLDTTPDKRDPEQVKLARLHEKNLAFDRAALIALDADFEKKVKITEAQIRALETSRRPQPRIQALWDRGSPSPTYIYRRGDPLTTGRLVGPGVPSVLTDGKTPFGVTPPWAGAKQTGRRLAFARWLTEPQNPLTARVAINRVWKHHFGTGIVKSVGNFGKTGTPPTHPELLDWLANEFVRQRWSLKAMHRLMMTSATYRQSSQLSAEREQLDPDNRLLSRMPLTRLDAEALYDTLLLVAGRLNETRFGPADPVTARADGLVTPRGNANGWRRLIYVNQARKQVATHLENFDFPQMNPNCLERRDSVVAPQALHLMNNGMIQELAGHFASRIQGAYGPEPSRQIDGIYQIALSRHPTTEEAELGRQSLEKLTRLWTAHLQSAGKVDAQQARTKALADYCHAMVNSAGFLYVD